MALPKVKEYPSVDNLITKVNGQLRIRLGRDARSMDFSVTDRRHTLIAGPMPSMEALNALCLRLEGIAKKGSAYPEAFGVLPNITERA